MKKPDFEAMATAFIDTAARGWVELRHEDFEAGYVSGFEHGSKRSVVRLTDEEIFAIRDSTIGRSVWGIKDFTNAIMDAMIAKNQPN